MREFDEVQGVGNDVSHEKRTFHEWCHRMEQVQRVPAQLVGSQDYRWSLNAVVRKARPEIWNSDPEEGRAM
jgi:hypothetical protein